MTAGCRRFDCTEANPDYGYTPEQELEIFATCELACGSLGPFDAALAEGEGQNATFTIQNLDGLVSTVGSLAVIAEWKAEEDKLVPLACGVVTIDGATCKDDRGFRDALGYSCAEWQGFDCVGDAYQYPANQLPVDTVLLSCPAACGSCFVADGEVEAVAGNADGAGRPAWPALTGPVKVGQDGDGILVQYELTPASGLLLGALEPAEDTDDAWGAPRGTASFAGTAAATVEGGDAWVALSSMAGASTARYGTVVSQVSGLALTGAVALLPRGSETNATLLVEGTAWSTDRWFRIRVHRGTSCNPDTAGALIGGDEADWAQVGYGTDSGTVSAKSMTVEATAWSDTELVVHIWGYTGLSEDTGVIGCAVLQPPRLRLDVGLASERCPAAGDAPPTASLLAVELPLSVNADGGATAGPVAFNTLTPDWLPPGDLLATLSVVGPTPDFSLGASVVACAKLLAPPTYTMKLAPGTGCASATTPDEAAFATIIPLMRPLASTSVGLGDGFANTSELVPAWLASTEREAQILDDAGNLVSCSPLVVAIDWIPPTNSLGAAEPLHTALVAGLLVALLTSV